MTGGLLYSPCACARSRTRASVRGLATVLLVAAMLPSTASAQERLTIRSDFLFYGDDTEFRNQFREGETIFGAAVRVTAEAGLNDRVTVAAGGFANQRFGSENAFEQVRPVLSLTVRGRRSAFILGTLPPLTSDAPAGPDRNGPHGLLPPLQRETLSYDRPYENGLAWTFNGSALQHHFWLEWQRLNTPAHRERFDGGMRTSYRLTTSSRFRCSFTSCTREDSSPVRSRRGQRRRCDRRQFQRPPFVAATRRQSSCWIGLPARPRSQPAGSDARRRRVFRPGLRRHTVGASMSFSGAAETTSRTKGIPTICRSTEAAIDIVERATIQRRV